MVDVDQTTWPTIAVVMILLVLLAGLIPAFYTNTNGVENEIQEINEGETIQLKAPLTVTLELVTNDQINVSVVDTKTGETKSTGLINESDTKELTLNNQPVNVTYVLDNGNSEAFVGVEYPIFYQWNDLLVSLIRIIGLIVLLIFVYSIFMLIPWGEGQ